MTPTPRLPVLVGACALGGALGSLARWGIAGLGGGDGAAASMSATLAVNLVGCLLLGFLLGSPAGQEPLRRAFLGAGVLGGFTTFSAFAVQVRLSVDQGDETAAVGYLLATLAGCLIAAHVGRRLAERGHTIQPVDEQGDA